MRMMEATRRAWVPPFAPGSYREGLRSMSPFAVAIVVWGIVTGVAMVNGGMPVSVALLVTVTVFAGSAQLATLPLLVAGSPLPIVWATALVVNLRFVIFSASSRNSFVMLPAKQRLLAGYLNGDLGFALFSNRFRDDPSRGTPEQWGYFYGGAAVNWVAWQVASIVGILIGDLAPTDWGLELAAYLALVAVLVPMATKFPSVAGIAVAVVVSLLTVGWPMRLGLLVAVVSGVVVAMTAEHLTTDRRPELVEVG
jgi:predicted branched-subunit amino acid permease